MEQVARIPKQLGAIIKRERRRQGLTQQQLGEKIRMRQATVSELEAGKPVAKLQTLVHVLSALQLEIVIRPRSRESAEKIEDVF
ncbi:MAG: helix-turn-helix domain-containing protein [Pseudomonadota bacterium]